MNQTVAAASSTALAVFDGELKEALAPIAAFAGLEALPLVVLSPSLRRSPISVDVNFHFRTSFYDRRFPGHPSNADGIPHVDHDVQAFVKEKADARFRAALEAESLRACLRSGIVSDGTRIVCDEVISLTRLTCGCDGGTVTCGGCRGSGAVACNHCQFTASFSGRVRCDACHGERGNHDTDGKWFNCYQCGGRGDMYCRACGGTQKMRCGGCGGHGAHTCSTCAGNGFVTDARCFKMEMSAVIGKIASSVPAHVIACIKAWINTGLAGHASERSNPVLPWSDFQTSRPSYLGWKDGVYWATLPLVCEVTHADLKAEYRGAESAVSYVRVHEPKFGFPNFLDIELADIAARTEQLAKERPSTFLREIKNVKGLADSLPDLVGTTDKWRKHWVGETAGRMKGAVSSDILDRIARHYQRSLKAFEKKAVASSFLNMTPVVACIAFAAWYFGVFDWLTGFNRDARIAVFFLTAAFFAALTNYAVKGSARGRVGKEVGGLSFLHLGAPSKVVCILVGLVISHVGMTAAVAGW